MRDFGVHDDANVMSQIQSHFEAQRMQVDTRQMLGMVRAISVSRLSAPQSRIVSVEACFVAQLKNTDKTNAGTLNVYLQKNDTKKHASLCWCLCIYIFKM